MRPAAAVGLPGFPLRANPAYRLRPWSAIPTAYREALGLETNVAGVLVADASAPWPDKVVDHRGAQLFSLLSQSPVGGEAPGAAGVEEDDALVDLVLDGVLGIITADGFATGPPAADLLLTASTLSESDDRLIRLSLDAIAYAARLPRMSIALLSARLYGYGRVPISPRWTRRHRGPEAIFDLLRRVRLEPYQLGLDPGGDWLYAQADIAAGTVALPYKLYVSPNVDATDDALPVAVATLADTRAPFKIGVGAAGLLRPDKLVVYLPDATALVQVAHQLDNALAGVSAHGVPFSAALTADGLLSWGGDPPADAGPVGAERESWRYAVCRRLAEHLVAALAMPPRSMTP